MTGINYRKHSQCLKELRDSVSLKEREEKYIQGVAACSWQTSVASSNTTLGGPQGVVNKRSTHKKTWTKLLVESSFHLTPAPNQEQGLPRAFSAISVKHPPKNDPLKAPPPKPPHHLCWLRAHSPEQAQKQLFTVTVH